MAIPAQFVRHARDVFAAGAPSPARRSADQVLFKRTDSGPAMMAEARIRKTWQIAEEIDGRPMKRAQTN
jgi:hypothetical protein